MGGSTTNYFGHHSADKTGEKMLKFEACPTILN